MTEKVLPRFHKRHFVAEWEKKSLVLLLLKLSFWTTHHLGAVGENNSLLATYCVIIVCSVLQHNYQESLIVPAGHHKKDYSLFIPSTQYLSYGAVRNLKNIHILPVHVSGSSFHHVLRRTT